MTDMDVRLVPLPDGTSHEAALALAGAYAGWLKHHPEFLDGILRSALEAVASADGAVSEAFDVNT